jgi:hypothetical protein
MSTTENIGKPYNVLGARCLYQEAAGFSFSGDPIQGAMNKAIERILEEAKKYGADAVVKFDIDFASRTQKDEGRLILCGTLVKYK